MVAVEPRHLCRDKRLRAHRGGFANRQNTKPRARRGWVREADADQADTTLIMRRFFGPFTENRTLPSVSANKV